MADCLMYWKYFWEDVEREPAAFNDEWYPKSVYFFQQVAPVIVSGLLYLVDRNTQANGNYSNESLSENADMRIQKNTRGHITSLETPS